MTGAYRRFLQAHIVANVDNAMSLCLDCGVPSCSEDHYQTCPHRLARASALDALDEASGPPQRGHRA